AEAFLEELLPRLPDGPEVVVCPPYPALARAVELCGERVAVAAQNMHEEPSGAFTGEVSAPMLVEIGVRAVILGHSERRQHFGESDEALARKLPAALDAGLQPILCVGEDEAQRDADETEAVIARQLEADLAGLGDDRLAGLVVAYEPIWAIGTGRTASPEQAQEAIALIRARLADRDAEAAKAVRILYGGSVKPGNAAELISQADVDGALVGGASLDPGDFLAIVEAAAEQT
ncbi:MAG: triose-phosphate isomerase, partial [Solirubrobacterales bacterium]